MSKCEYAQMVEIMRTHQKHRDTHMTHESTLTASHCERAVDKATQQILADVSVDEPDVAHIAK